MYALKLRAKLFCEGDAVGVEVCLGVGDTPGLGVGVGVEIGVGVGVEDGPLWTLQLVDMKRGRLTIP